MSNTEDTQTPAERLKMVRQHHDVSQREFAAAIGVNLRTYQSYERGERSITKDFLSLIAQKTTVNPKWIERSERPIYIDDDKNENGLIKSVVSKLFPKSMNLPDEDRVSYIWIDAIGGHHNPDVRGSDSRAIMFSVKFIGTMTQTNDNNIKIFIQDSDAMEPEINNGDIILIDCELKSVTSDGIYLIESDGYYMIRRVLRGTRGIATILCSNPQCRDYTQETLISDLKIIGRAFWVGKRLV